MKINKSFFLIFILCSVSLCYKLILFKDVNLYLSSDSAIYGTLATRFAQGDFLYGMHLWWFPLFPFVSGLVYLFIPKIEYALFFTNALSSSLLIVPLYLILKRITRSIFVAIVGAFAASLNYSLTVSHINLLSEMTYVTALLFAVATFMLALQKGSKKNIFISGVCFGLAFLARSEAMFFFVLSIMFLFIYLLSKRRRFLFSLKSLSFFIIAFFISISPYLLFNYLQYNTIKLSAKSNAAFKMGSPFAIDKNGRNFAQDVWSVDTPNYQSFYFTEPFNFKERYWGFIEGAIIRARTYITYILRVTSPVILFVSTVGFFLLLFRSRRAKEFLYIPYIFVVGFLLTMPFLPQAETRYIYWLYPFGYLFIFTLVSYLKFFFKPGVASLTFYLLLFLIVGGYTVTSSNMIIDREVNEVFGPTYKKIGETIKKQNIKQPKIMTRIEAMTFYADGTTIYIPTSIDYDQLLSYARKTKTDFIVVNKLMFISDTRLANLLDNKMDFPGLKRVATFEDNLQSGIYKVL